jgi:hypothetical protein
LAYCLAEGSLLVRCSHPRQNHARISRVGIERLCARPTRPRSQSE